MATLKMTSGIMEKISRQQGRDWIKEVKSGSGKLLKGEQMMIMRKDGTVEKFDSDSDLSKLNTYGIEGVAYLTQAGLGISGAGFKFESIATDKETKDLVDKMNKTNLKSGGANTDAYGKFAAEKAGKIMVTVDKDWLKKIQNKSK